MRRVTGTVGPLAIGVSVLWLSIIVLLPLAALTFTALSGGLGEFWDAVTAPAALAALRVTLGTSAVVALMTRKESSDRPSQMGDVVADDVGDGLVVLSSITPATTTGSGPGRRLAPSLSPYYQVLIKGERLATKPGRADDFAWPRAELEIAPEPLAVPAKRLPRQKRTGAPRS